MPKVLSILEELAKLPVTSANRRNAISALRALPQEELERQLRGIEQFPISAFHGTRSPEDFPQFERGDLGYHFGTAEQANRRLDHTRMWTDAPHNERILPVRLNIRRPLEMADVGMWGDPYEVMSRIRPRAIREAHGFNDMHLEAQALRDQFEDRDAWVNSREAEDMLSDLRGRIKAEGYDGIKYKNEVENAFGEHSDLVPRARDVRSRLDNKLKGVFAEIRKRDVPPPQMPATEEAVNAWLKRELPKPLPHEQYEIDRLRNRAMRVNEIGRGPTDSYIAFDPEQIRSRFAQFDPMFKNSGDLLKANGGAVAGLPRMR